MNKPTADRHVFREVRAVFARAELDDMEALNACITMVGAFARLLGVSRGKVIKMLDESSAVAAMTDPRGQGSA